MTSLRNGRLGKLSIDLLFSLLGKLDHEEVVAMKDEMAKEPLSEEINERIS